MTEKPVIEAEFCTFKHVPTRKVFQIILELPEEKMASAFAVLGHPNGKQISVAVCRLVPPDARQEPVEASGKEPRRFDSLPLPQQAALLCQDGAFWKFVHEKYGIEMNAGTEVDQSREWLRLRCGVSSRAHILPGTQAADNFLAIRDGFQLWKKGYE